MLKYLTQKLQNSAISEEYLNKKNRIDDDQDSGTESDENIDDLDTEMDTPSPIIIGEVTSTSSPYFSDSSSLSSSSLSLRHPSDNNDVLYDAHSSEEELEVINNSHQLQKRKTSPCISTTTAEKRKWSQIDEDNDDDEVDDVNMQRQSRSSLSSDEEVTGLFSISSTPLQFRTSPPINVLKPGQRLLSSPQLKTVNNSNSPRKKYRHCSSSSSSSNSSQNNNNNTSQNSQQISSNGNANHVQRPCLDFEKMQEMKARAVTTWRHGGELSVFCW